MLSLKNFFFSFSIQCLIKIFLISWSCLSRVQILTQSSSLAKDQGEGTKNMITDMYVQPSSLQTGLSYIISLTLNLSFVRYMIMILLPGARTSHPAHLPSSVHSPDGKLVCLFRGEMPDQEQQLPSDCYPSCSGTVTWGSSRCS